MLEGAATIAAWIAFAVVFALVLWLILGALNASHEAGRAADDLEREIAERSVRLDGFVVHPVVKTPHDGSAL